MITLKKWNSIPFNKRRKIAKLVFNNMPEDFREAAANTFHHDFDYNAQADNEVSGCFVKIMLKHCTETKEGNIKVTIEI